MKLGERHSERWVTYHLDDETIRFKIRFYSSAKIEELTAKHTDTHVGDDGVAEDTINADGFYQEALDWVIQDWEGIEDPGGAALPCTPEARIALADDQPAIPEFLFTLAKIRQTFSPDIESFKKKLSASLGIPGNGRQTKPRRTAKPA